MWFDYYTKTGIFFENILQSTLSVVKVLVLSKFNLPKFSNQKTNASILGNGPSLNQTLADNLDFLKETDTYCVNNFASSHVFTAIKPQNYVILDPAFYMFSPENDARQDIKQTLEAILSLTDWKMRLFVPTRSRNAYIVRQLNQHKPNVEICLFNYTIVRGFAFVRHWFFEKNLGTPQCQNVMAVCIYVALLQNYKNIYLFGADHSWHEEIRITEQNEFEMRQIHFYDNTSEVKHQKIVDVRNNARPRLQAQFLSLHKVFYSYEILQTFAEFRNIKILNASTKSYVDAFKKIKI